MLQPKIEFRQPYYVSPHAIGNFQERVLALLGRTLPRMLIIQTINAALQVRRDPAWTFRMQDGRIGKVYGAMYSGIQYYIPTIHDHRPGKTWDIVPTILGPDMSQKKQEDEDESRKTL